MIPIMPNRERGTALIIAMLFLVILGMLGVTTMTNTTLDERMAGNSRDRDIAMQAAEAALRDAERDLSNTNSAFRVVALANFPAFPSANCVAALCAEGAAQSNLTDPVRSAFYGQFSGELPLDGPTHDACRTALAGRSGDRAIAERMPGRRDQTRAGGRIAPALDGGGGTRMDQPRRRVPAVGRLVRTAGENARRPAGNGGREPDNFERIGALLSCTHVRGRSQRRTARGRSAGSLPG